MAYLAASWILNHTPEQAVGYLPLLLGYFFVLLAASMPLRKKLKRWQIVLLELIAKKKLTWKLEERSKRKIYEHSIDHSDITY